MKIIAASDLHGTLPEIPACDLLLLGGDLCPVCNHKLDFQAEWLDTTFRTWLEQVPARQIVGVAGNHDLLFERQPKRVPNNLRWHYLCDSGILWENLHIWGSPWQPWFHDWAFNLTEDKLREKWALIPADTDILVLHGPPYGFGDAVPSFSGEVIRTGSTTLFERIQTIQPRLVIFGHIHEGRGQWTLGRTVLANVTLLNRAYEPVYPPWEFEFTD